VSAAAEPEASAACDTEQEMAEADEANGEGSPANDTGARYGKDESAA
jgi:hypothetical protein